MAYIKPGILKKLQSGINKRNEKNAKDQQFMRECVLLSKKAIVAAHNGNLVEARKHEKQLSKEVAKFSKQRLKDDYVEKMIGQEWAEALFFIMFLEDRQFPGFAELPITEEAYVLGLCDLSGELVRYGLDCALRNDFNEVKRVKGLLDELYDGLQGIILKGELRKKADKVRWDLERIANVLLGEK